MSDPDFDQLSFDAVGDDDVTGEDAPSAEGTAAADTLREAAPAPGPVPVPAATAPPPPTPEQAAAIGNRDRDVFLEAGAGTGKTRVLVARYCEAVDRDGVDPERILAFTFTERAAGEMRRRLRAELSRRAAEAQENVDQAGEPERRERLIAASRLGGGATISTIHGFCRRILAAHPVAAGLDPRFRVLGGEEASRLARSAFDATLAEEALVDDGIALLAAGFKPSRLARVVTRAFAELRSKGIDPPGLPPLEPSAAAVDGAAPGETSPAEAEDLRRGHAALGRLLEAFSDRYAQLKSSRSAVDFDDLQLVALRLLRENPQIAASQRERFDHILVDEFQDTDPVQLELIHAIAGPETRLFTVGDEAQSIYGFRGADLDCFRRERARTEEAPDGPGGSEALALTGSFRSTPRVVAAVNLVGEAVVGDYRPLRVGKPAGPAEGAEAAGGAAADQPAIELLVTASKGWDKEAEGTKEGTEIGTEIGTAVGDSQPNRIAEARVLARRLRELADDGVDPASMVVLLRAFTHVAAYAEALELAGLNPYVVGGRGYWSSQQVADAIRLLSCVANPLDDEPLLGALASPACALAPDTLWMLRKASRGHLWPTVAELSRHVEEGEDVEADEGQDQPAPAAGAAEDDPRAEERRLWAERIPADERARLREFHDRLVSLRGRAPLLPLDELVERTLEAFDYDLAALQMDDGLRRTANLLKLVRMAAEYDRDEARDLRGFLRSTADRAALADRDAEAAVAAEDHAGVKIMTIHAAKGLEFDCVAVADLSRNLGAGGRPAELQVSDPVGASPRVAMQLARPGAPTLRLAGYQELCDAAADVEAAESGRLAYVAASRARERLILSGLLDPRWNAEKDEAKEKRKRTPLGCLLARAGIEDVEGWEQRTVPIPPAQARPGLEQTYPPARMTVRLHRPTAEEAAALAYDFRSGRAGTAIAGGTPPMLSLDERGTAAARHLSYAALTAYQRCGYRFLVERVLRLGGGPLAPSPVSTSEEDEDVRADEWDEDPPPHEAAGANDGKGAVDADRAADGEAGRAPRTANAGGSAVGFGRAVHLLLERAAGEGWRDPGEQEVIAALREEGIGAASSKIAVTMAEGWLESELLAELRAAGAGFRTEVPFRLGIGEDTVVRGNIDLLATGPEMIPTIVDYKTDRVGEDGPAMSAAYEIQRALYCSAVAEATGADRVRCVHFFLQAPESPQIAELSRDEIVAARATAERLAAAIRAGEFTPTDEPHAGLCHDCPARLRLCSHGPELTLRSL